MRGQLFSSLPFLSCSDSFTFILAFRKESAGGEEEAKRGRQWNRGRKNGGKWREEKATHCHRSKRDGEKKERRRRRSREKTAKLKSNLTRNQVGFSHCLCTHVSATRNVSQSFLFRSLSRCLITRFLLSLPIILSRWNGSFVTHTLTHTYTEREREREVLLTYFFSSTWNWEREREKQRVKLGPWQTVVTLYSTAHTIANLHASLLC